MASPKNKSATLQELHNTQEKVGEVAYYECRDKDHHGVGTACYSDISNVREWCPSCKKAGKVIVHLEEAEKALKNWIFR